MQKTPIKPKKLEQTLSSDAFFDAIRSIDQSLPAKIEAWLEALEPLGVYPEFKKSLFLRLGTPQGDVATLGCIFKNGKVWTDGVFASLNGQQAAMVFFESLADAFDCEIGEMSGQPLLKKNGKIPDIQDLVGRPMLWVKAVNAMLEELRRERLNS